MNCLSISMAIEIRRNGIGNWDGAHVSINDHDLEECDAFAFRHERSNLSLMFV